MCLILFAVDPEPGTRLLLAANRDEEHARPTQPAERWPSSNVFAGRDLRGGGTWLGVSKDGRLAALTNVRHPGARREGASRGALPVRFLTTSLSPDAFAASVGPELATFPSFNLLLFDPREGTFFWSDEGGAPALVAPGLHGLSNARLDVSWPKVARGLDNMQAALGERGEARTEALFRALADDRTATDDELPATGVPLEVERLLSPAFIRGPVYGTRCSTVVSLHDDGSVFFEERSFAPSGAPGPVVRHAAPAAQ